MKGIFPVNPLRKRCSVEERFHYYVLPEPNSGCWLWCGTTNACGYGTLGVANKSVLAHRFSYELHIGPVLGQLNVLHSCDVPCCVNPDHLFTGTQYVNILDMEQKGRSYHPSREEHGRAVLNWDVVRCIRSDTRSNAALGRIFGVTKTNVRAVRKYKIWRDDPCEQQ